VQSQVDPGSRHCSEATARMGRLLRFVIHDYDVDPPREPDAPG
jgi:hypothetical protein